MITDSMLEPTCCLGATLVCGSVEQRILKLWVLSMTGNHDLERMTDNDSITVDES